MGKNTDVLGNSLSAISYWADVEGLSSYDQKEIDSMVPVVLAEAMLYGNGSVDAIELMNTVRKALLAAFQLGKNSQ